MRTLGTPSLTLAAVAALAATALSLPSPASAREATPPANDDIADATPIFEGSNRADTTLGATRESTDPQSLYGEHTVWYSFSSDAGTPFQVETTPETDNPDYNQRFVVYQGTPGDLDKVAVSGQEDPRYYSRPEVARFPTEKDVTYYIGVVSSEGDGGDFTLTVERAKIPSTLNFPDMMVIGSGPTGQLYVDRGQHPRVRIRVKTGFAKERVGGRGPVTLVVEGGDTYTTRLDNGRATFVLPKTRHGFSFEVDYPGTARIDSATGHASMLVSR